MYTCGVCVLRLPLFDVCFHVIRLMLPSKPSVKQIAFMIIRISTTNYNMWKLLHLFC
uniref:Uncharacterized protein n=1 Tax=Rhizophora mucronata TaxID=61149 RepID=A0A2P2PQ52_RHIMU